MSDFAKKLTIQMNVSDLDENQINQLQSLFLTYSGDHILNFVIFEMNQKIKIHMPSKKKKVKICNELIEELDKINISYKLN